MRIMKISGGSRVYHQHGALPNAHEVHEDLESSMPSSLTLIMVLFQMLTRIMKISGGSSALTAWPANCATAGPHQSQPRHQHSHRRHDDDDGKSE